MFSDKVPEEGKPLTPNEQAFNCKPSGQNSVGKLLYLKSGDSRSTSPKIFVSNEKSVKHMGQLEGFLMALKENEAMGHAELVPICDLT